MVFHQLNTLLRAEKLFHRIQVVFLLIAKMNKTKIIIAAVDRKNLNFLKINNNMSVVLKVILKMIERIMNYVF